MLQQRFEVTPAADSRRIVRRMGRWLQTVAACAAVTALLGACGNAGDAAVATTSATPASGDLAAEVEAVRAFMADRYLYAPRLANVELSGISTAEQALAALRVEPPDRFSYVERRGTYQAFFDGGRALGLGIGYLIDGDALRLRFVQPHSPAAAAGLARGDRLLAIDGVPTSELISAGSIVAAFGPSEIGTTLRLAVQRGELQFDATVSKNWYPVATVLDSRLIDHQGERIGYVLLYTFTESTRAEWADAVAGLAAAGARALVVDLRDNGGGRLMVAAEVAGSLAPAGAAGAIFAQLRHNDIHRWRDAPIPVPANPAAGIFERVVWITSRRTCSASEVLIAGLMPFRASATVGGTTCGKPVGFNPHLLANDKVLSAVTFTASNGAGFGEWFDGLPPSCAVDDEPLLPYGDVADPSLREALTVVATGHCSVRPTLKSTRRALQTLQPREFGLASVTGLK